MSNRTTTRLPHWIGHCDVHGQIEVHQDTPPTKCHHELRLRVTCNRKLQRVKKIPFTSKKWQDELERSAS